MIRAVIFDFNGILADDDPIHMQALREVAREEGMELTEESYIEHYLPLNDWDCFRELFAANRRVLKDGEIDALIERKSAYYFEELAKKPVLFGGAPDAIQAAARLGPVAIASGARISEIRHILTGGGLLDRFSTIVAAEDVQNGKPHPEPFERAFEQLKSYCAELTPADCLAVEDSLGGIESAYAAGIPCLGVAHSYPRSRLETSKARWVIDSIADFSGWLEQRERLDPLDLLDRR